MSERYTRRDAERAFDRLSDALGKDHGPTGRVMDGGRYRANVGTWYLDYNAIYGGAVVEEIVNESGGVSHPLGETRRTPREFCAMVNFALRVLEVADKR